MTNFMMAVYTIATIIIAIYAWRSHKLAEQIKHANELRETEDKEFRQRISDLYQAIVISTLLSAPSGYGAIGEAIDAFRSYYKGKTLIFK